MKAPQLKSLRHQRGPGGVKPIHMKLGGLTNIGRVGKISFGFGGKVNKHGS